MKTLIFKPGKRVITIIRIQNSHSICWKIKIDYAETVDAAILMSKKNHIIFWPYINPNKAHKSDNGKPFLLKKKSTRFTQKTILWP